MAFEALLAKDGLDIPSKVYGRSGVRSPSRGDCRIRQQAGGEYKNGNGQLHRVNIQPEESVHPNLRRPTAV